MRCEHTEVVVEGLRVETYVGLHDPEMLSIQPIVVDLRCALVAPEVPGDDLSLTFDYVPILDEVRALALQKRRRLIETFAREIAELCLRDARVAHVVVSVRKPDKFPAVSAVGVTRTFRRKEAP